MLEKCLGLFMACLSVFYSVEITAQKPNIVVIMCDDMGFSDIEIGRAHV